MFATFARDRRWADTDWGILVETEAGLYLDSRFLPRNGSFRCHVATLVLSRSLNCWW